MRNNNVEDIEPERAELLIFYTKVGELGSCSAHPGTPADPDELVLVISPIKAESLRLCKSCQHLVLQTMLRDYFRTAFRKERGHGPTAPLTKTAV